MMMNILYLLALLLWTIVETINHFSTQESGENPARAALVLPVRLVIRMLLCMGAVHGLAFIGQAVAP